MELVQRQPLRRRVEQVGEREPERRSFGAEVLAREPVDRQRAERDGDRLAHEQQVGARPDQPERRERGEDRVEVRAEPRDLVAAQARDLRADAREPSTRPPAPCCRGRSGRSRTRGAAGPRAPRSRPRTRRSPPRGGRAARMSIRSHAATARSRSSRHRRAEHLLARLCLVGGPAALAEALRRARRRLQPAQRRRERLRVAGRDEQRALARATSNSRAAGRVGGDERRSAGERLERLVRDHPRALSEVPKIPSAQPARWSSPGRRS